MLEQVTSAPQKTLQSSQYNHELLRLNITFLSPKLLFGIQWFHIKSCNFQNIFCKELLLTLKLL